MNVAIGNDHHGVELKRLLVLALKEAGHSPINVGTDGPDSVDYPDFASEVAGKVSSGDADRGILICGSGTGMAIAANKVQGVRAAVCFDERTAKLSRQHNNTNVLCLSGQWVENEDNLKIVTLWINEEFEGGRHQRRVTKIGELEGSPRCE